jgi:beta-hydroxyacyl-ACP dehydratase FabZ
VSAEHLDIQRILEFMPHRYPFLLIDRILEFTPDERIVGLKNVTFNEPYFQGHFPDHPIMPGVLIVEAMAQAGGLLLMNEVDRPADKIVYFMSMDDVKFRRPVVPGDQLILEVEMVKKRSTTCKVRGVASVDGQRVSEATMTARVVDR